MENDNFCVAITKNHTRCKSYHMKKTIFCYVHNKRKSPPDNVVINVNKTDYSLTLKPYVNKVTYLKDVAEYKDNILKEEIKNKLIIDNITSCKVCYDEIPNNELIRCSNVTTDNKHLICNTCIKEHVNTLISSGIGNYDCMFNKSDKCGGHYDDSTILKTFDNDDIKLKWLELIHISDIIKFATICDDYIICPLCCKWGCIFETLPGEVMLYIDCKKCNKQWCNTCKRESHGDISCYNLNFKDEETNDKRIEIIDHMIQEIITKSITRSCQSCGSSYIKEEGCNLMQCSKCGGLSCYICNMKLYIKDDTKYWHFSGHPNADPGAICQLWNNDAGDGKIDQGNLEYNNKLIKKELKLFVNENELETAKLIVDRVRIILSV